MIIELLALILIALLVILLFKIFKKVIIFIFNAIIGLLALFAFNFLTGAHVAINFWSVVIVAIGGLIGFAVVILLYLLGVAFR